MVIYQDKCLTRLQRIKGTENKRMSLPRRDSDNIKLFHDCLLVDLRSIPCIEGVASIVILRTYHSRSYDSGHNLIIFYPVKWRKTSVWILDEVIYVEMSLL